MNTDTYLQRDTDASEQALESGVGESPRHRANSFDCVLDPLDTVREIELHNTE